MEQALESVAEVKMALEKLLAEDDNDWEDPYLCLRLLDLSDEGQISLNTYVNAKAFINRKIDPHTTLVSYHRDVVLTLYESNALATSREWPAIRKQYLREWIEELS